VPTASAQDNQVNQVSADVVVDDVPRFAASENFLVACAAQQITRGKAIELLLCVLPLDVQVDRDRLQGNKDGRDGIPRMNDKDLCSVVLGECARIG